MSVDVLPEGSEPSYLQTDFPSNIYGFNKNYFSPKNFHLHHLSEHSIMGRRVDIEFHIPHYTDDNTNGLSG